MAVTYPLFVFEKDGQSMQLIENPSHICTSEAVDILNGEYIFWDANGNGVSVAASVTSFMLEIGDATPCVALLSLHDAFSSYVKTLGLPDFDVDGPPSDVWRRIRKEIDARPEKQSFVSRLFR
jgi:hypothetical protein